MKMFKTRIQIEILHDGNLPVPEVSFDQNEVALYISRLNKFCEERNRGVKFGGCIIYQVAAEIVDDTSQ
jgi:hypothetical protein